MEFLTPQRMLNPGAETGATVLRVVEDAYAYPRRTLLRRGNAKKLAHPRSLAIFLMTEMGMTLEQIGHFFSRHHTTVRYSRNLVATVMETDSSVRVLVERLKAKIQEENGKTLPNVALGGVAGMEDLDSLIQSGRGDEPRVPLRGIGVLALLNQEDAA